MVIKHGANLKNVERCPHCGIAYPLLQQSWNEQTHHSSKLCNSYEKLWAVYECSTCNSYVLAEGKGSTDPRVTDDTVEKLYPAKVTVSDDIPDTARNYLEQAINSYQAPDGAVMLANSAVDAMLKENDLCRGSVYDRIDQAVKKGILTAGMGEWAHKVRFESNKPRHADSNEPHATVEQAKQTVEFAQALGYFLFELQARIDRGKQAAEEADE